MFMILTTFMYIVYNPQYKFKKLIRYYLFYILFFWPQGRDPRPGIKPSPPALQGEVLTTGLAGKSLIRYYLDMSEPMPRTAKSNPHITEYKLGCKIYYCSILYNFLSLETSYYTFIKSMKILIKSMIILITQHFFLKGRESNSNNPWLHRIPGWKILIMWYIAAFTKFSHQSVDFY